MKQEEQLQAGKWKTCWCTLKHDLKSCYWAMTWRRKKWWLLCYAAFTGSSEHFSKTARSIVTDRCAVRTVVPNTQCRNDLLCLHCFFGHTNLDINYMYKWFKPDLKIFIQKEMKQKSVLFIHDALHNLVRQLCMPPPGSFCVWNRHTTCTYTWCVCTLIENLLCSRICARCFSTQTTEWFTHSGVIALWTLARG